jgi:hypothetical protein
MGSAVGVARNTASSARDRPCRCGCRSTRSRRPPRPRTRSPARGVPSRRATSPARRRSRSRD